MMICVIALTLNSILLALNPVQQWRSAGRLPSSYMVQRWFVITAIIVLILLTLLLLVIILYRTSQQQKKANLLFEGARERDLSAAELKMLTDIADNAGPKHEMAVFTAGEAFDLGAGRIIEKSISAGSKPGKVELLRRDFSMLRKRLGFPSEQANSPQRPTKPNTRQIPVGKKMLLTRRTGAAGGEIEATVVQNGDLQLTVEPAQAVRIGVDDLWSVRCLFGASVWEFDTSVVSYDGSTLVLSHGYNARYVNRRRFKRVPVNKEALVAPFPFTGTIEQRSNGAEANSYYSRLVKGNSPVTLRAPELFPAIVTELAGPGLRLRQTVEVKRGDRVLVVLKVDETDGLNPYGKKFGYRQRTSEIVQDIGVVRHVKPVGSEYSVAVELTGLNDADIDHLVRATNAASISTVGKSQPIVVETRAAEQMLEAQMVPGA